MRLVSKSLVNVNGVPKYVSALKAGKATLTRQRHKALKRGPLP